ncbi:MAG: hypothetical protein Q7R97_04760 [Candidatus Daviesbacteria bacterium]|nr:hypothetical protein [Candidatus Daviesbacteria bacterium]
MLETEQLAKENFASAVALAKTFDFRSDQIRLNSHIGKCLAGAGLDYSAQLQFLSKILPRVKGKKEAEERRSALYGMADIYLAGNDPQSAFKIISLDRNRQSFLRPHFDLKIAREFAKLGQDPSKALKRVSSNIRNVTGEDGLKDFIQANDYIGLAETQYDLGIDHKPALTKAHSLFEKLGSEKSVVEGKLARLYAIFGDPEMVLDIVEKIQDQNPDQTIHRKTEVLRSASRASLARGDVDTALEIADEESDLLMAEIAAGGAVQAVQNKNSESAGILIGVAMDHIDRPQEEALSDYEEGWQAEVYSLIDRAKILTGVNHVMYGGRPFLQSLDIASIVRDALYRASTYNEIAKNQALVDIDAKPAWKLALESVAKELRRSEGNSWTEGVCLLTLEDFTNDQVECGYYDTALDTVEQMIKIDEITSKKLTNRYYEVFKTEVLADIGLAQVKKSRKLGAS